MALADFLSAIGGGANLVQNFDATRQAREATALKQGLMINEHKNAMAQERRQQAQHDQQMKHAEQLEAKDALESLQPGEVFTLDPTNPEQALILKYYPKEFTKADGVPGGMTLRMTPKRVAETHQAKVQELLYEKTVREQGLAAAQFTEMERINQLKTSGAWAAMPLRDRQAAAVRAGQPEAFGKTEDEGLKYEEQKAFATAAPQIAIHAADRASAERVANIGARARQAVAAAKGNDVAEQIPGAIARAILENNEIETLTRKSPRTPDEQAKLERLETEIAARVVGIYAAQGYASPGRLVGPATSDAPRGEFIIRGEVPKR